MAENVKPVPFDGDIAKSVNVKLSLETTGEDGVSDELYQSLYSWLCNALQQERGHWKKQLDSALKELNRQHKASLSVQKSLQKLLDKFDENSTKPVRTYDLDRPSQFNAQNEDEFVTVDVEHKPVTIESLLLKLEANIDKLFPATHPLTLTKDLETQDKTLNQDLNSNYENKKYSNLLSAQQQTENSPGSEDERACRIVPSLRPAPTLREKHFIKLPQPKDKHGLVLSENNTPPKPATDKQSNPVMRRVPPESKASGSQQKIIWQKDKESVKARAEQNSSENSKTPLHDDCSTINGHITNQHTDSTVTSLPLNRVKNNRQQNNASVHISETLRTPKGQNEDFVSETLTKLETQSPQSTFKSTQSTLNGNADDKSVESDLQSVKLKDKVIQRNAVSAGLDQSVGLKQPNGKPLPVSQCQVVSMVPKQQAVVHPFLKKGNNNKPQETFSVKKYPALQQEERQNYERAIQGKKKEIKFLKSDLEEALDQVENLQKIIQRLYLLNKNLTDTPKSLKGKFVEDNDIEGPKSKKSNAGISTKLLSRSLPTLKTLPILQPMSASDMATWKLKLKQKHLPARKTDLAHCLRCHQLFRPIENNNVSCRYHRNGQECTEKYDGRGNLVRVLYKWSCCQRDLDAPGCTHNQHI